MNSNDLRAAAFLEARNDASINWIEPLANWGGLALLFLCLVPCIRLVWCDQRILSGVIPGWAGQIIWALVMCMGAPMLMKEITGNDRVWWFFPEPVGVIAFGLFGWMSAGVYSFIVWAVREFWSFGMQWRNERKT